MSEKLSRSPERFLDLRIVPGAILAGLSCLQLNRFCLELDYYGSFGQQSLV